ncbi:GNAT family protein [Croceibacter atlanticus]|jgi:hypothetical protein|uniref:GNAT family protein n=1 Tax=Croceibacter atlanticus TaxID=313588 RepID=UPI0030DA6AA1|tara:strand:- start:164627 stop:165310 length:684 start_codon:yes stop_codon:yes gene_type:complete
MTSEQLQSFINQLNSKEYTPNIFLHQIANNVDYGDVWELDNKSQKDAYCTFFIKDNDNYIGAVMRHYKDLHWYLDPNYRSNGHLTSALSKVILPYIFDELLAEEQYITIDKNLIGNVNYIKSKALALRCGFVQIDDINFKLVASVCESFYDDSQRVFKGLTKETISSLKDEFCTISKRLKLIESQIDNSYEANIEEYNNFSLSQMASKIEFLKIVIEDMEEDFQTLN